MNDIALASNQAADPALDVPPIMVPEKFVAAVFDPFKRKLASAKRAAAKVESYDITTTAGMAQAKELRASFRDIRTALENERKARKAPIIAAGKLLDTRAAELTAEIEPLESKYDAEIKAEEKRKEDEKQRKLAEERARVEAIENRIANIRGAASRLASADSGAIKAELNTWTILRLDPADYQEYLEEALTAVNTTIDQLTDLLAKAEEREAEARRVAAEREELARLKAEQAAREQAEREAAAERERIAQAERDAAAAERKRLEDEMAEMRRQMEAMRATMAPTPASLGDDPRTAHLPSPVAEAPAAPVDLPVSMTFEAPSQEDAAEITGYTASIVPEADVVPRPDKQEVIDLLAAHYCVFPATAEAWIVEWAKEIGL